MSVYHVASNLHLTGCLTPNNLDHPSKMSITNTTTSTPNSIPITNSHNNNNNSTSTNDNSQDNIATANNFANSPTSDLEMERVNGNRTPIQMDIPSPPLSPYARPNSTFDESDTRFATLLITPKPTSKINLTSLESDDEYTTINNNSSYLPKKRSLSDNTNDSSNEVKFATSINKNVDNSTLPSFPIEDMSSSSLIINPYIDLKTPGYKKRQFRFLAQYKLVSTKYSKPSSNTSSMSHSSTLNSRFNTIPKNRFYSNTSDTDVSESKIRTRRIVKEASVALESDDNSTSISRPSTPKRRKPNNVNRRLDSPFDNGGNTSSPAPAPYNFNYRNVPDYTPALPELPNNNRCLKTEWKGSPMDLSNDPLINELHPAEIQLAATLRLPCNVYLDSKRRIIEEKVLRLRSNRPFRRTDAQKACKIDVNKASRLFVSFEKVGWLNDKNFKQYL